MRFVIQRVQHAEITVDHKNIASIQKGFLVLVGISADDTKAIADKMIQKLIHLRIFEDENGKTNLDLNAVSGEMLIVSQFTLYADCKRGTVLLLQDPAHRGWRRNYMNISFISVKRKFLRFHMEFSVRI